MTTKQFFAFVAAVVLVAVAALAIPAQAFDLKFTGNFENATGDISTNGSLGDPSIATGLSGGVAASFAVGRIIDLSEYYKDAPVTFHQFYFDTNNTSGQSNMTLGLYFKLYGASRWEKLNNATIAGVYTDPSTVILSPGNNTSLGKKVITINNLAATSWWVIPEGTANNALQYDIYFTGGQMNMKGRGGI